MVESLSGRVRRIVSGTANSLVSAVENLAPDMIMEEAIREVDKAIDDVRAELGKVLSKAHMANTRLAEENRKHESLSEKIRIALGESRDDLAEAAAARLIDIEAQIPLLEGTIGETRDAQKELEGYIGALQGRKREMQEEFQALKAHLKAQSAGAEGPSSGNRGVAAAVGRAEEAFSRAMGQAGGIGLEGGIPSGSDAAKLAELDELARANRIKERLAAFRAED